MIKVYLGIARNDKSTNSRGANDREIQYGFASGKHCQIPHDPIWIQHSCIDEDHWFLISHTFKEGFIERSTQNKGRVTLGSRVPGCPTLKSGWYSATEIRPGVVGVNVSRCAQRQNLASPTLGEGRSRRSEGEKIWISGTMWKR